MNTRTLLGVVIFLSVAIPAVSLAGASAKAIMEDGAQKYPPNNGDVCVLSGPPPEDLQYEVLARIVATKRTYGSVDELFAPMVREARMIGADAIINLQASQRFKGPMPWRITSPTGDGQAIKVLPESPKLDCLQIGGQLSDPSGSIVSYSTESSISVAPETAPRSESNPNGIGRSESEAPRETEVDLYKELLKLDDLRQRGILTDDEFQAEKKKLLDKN